MKHKVRASSLGLVLLLSNHAQAQVVNGFEFGLDGWDYVGDVSVQTSAIGLAPTQGSQMAFISTMCDRNAPPIQGGGCATTINEHPYSGVSSPFAAYGRYFLGMSGGLATPPGPLGDGGPAFLAAMPPTDGPINKVGESGAIKTTFFAPESGVISFDWNKIGSDPDSVYFSLWSADPASTFRVNDWLYSPASIASGVDLCSRYYDVAPSPGCYGGQSSFNTETGWSTRSIGVAAPGWYTIGFAMGEIADGTVPTVLALDNLTFQAVASPVPEPQSFAMWLLGVLGLSTGALRRRRTAKTRGAGALAERAGFEPAEGC